MQQGLDPCHPKHPNHVMVWGSSGYHGVRKLEVWKKNQFNERYSELLVDHLKDCCTECQSEITRLKQSVIGWTAWEWTTLQASQQTVLILAS